MQKSSAAIGFFSFSSLQKLKEQSTKWIPATEKRLSETTIEQRNVFHYESLNKIKNCLRQDQ